MESLAADRTGVWWGSVLNCLALDHDAIWLREELVNDPTGNSGVACSSVVLLTEMPMGWMVRWLSLIVRRIGIGVFIT